MILVATTAHPHQALDGKVERDGQGKEVRYPVILNAKEKLIARKVCQAFKVRDSLSVILCEHTSLDPLTANSVWVRPPEGQWEELCV